MNRTICHLIVNPMLNPGPGITPLPRYLGLDLGAAITLRWAKHWGKPSMVGGANYGPMLFPYGPGRSWIVPAPTTVWV